MSGGFLFIVKIKGVERTSKNIERSGAGEQIRGKMEIGEMVVTFLSSASFMLFGDATRLRFGHPLWFERVKSAPLATGICVCEAYVKGLERPRGSFHLCVREGMEHIG